MTYDPASVVPYRLSRSKIELFVRCARCFYVDRRLGVAPPDSSAFGLQLAVDVLLKREFDRLRLHGDTHPVITRAGLDAHPLAHPSLEEWRDNMRGIRFLHTPTNFLVQGAIDDLWVDGSGRMIVVDYKTTSTEYAPSLSGRWGGGYKRQLEVYQWLLRQLGYPVAPTAYILYANADRTRESFDARLEFSLSLVAHIGSDAWVEEALQEAKLCLDRTVPPSAAPDCEWCAYQMAGGEGGI